MGKERERGKKEQWERKSLDFFRRCFILLTIYHQQLSYLYDCCLADLLLLLLYAK